MASPRQRVMCTRYPRGRLRVCVFEGGEGQVRLRLPFVEKPSKNWLLSPHGSHHHHHHHPCVVDSVGSLPGREREREGRGRFFNLPPFIYWNFRPGRLYGLFGLDARIEPLGGRNTEGLGDYRERGFRVVCETNIVGGEVLINERCVPRHL